MGLLINLIFLPLFACTTAGLSDPQNEGTAEESSALLPTEDERVAIETEDDDVGSCPDYINYQTVGKPFMTTWCTACHNSSLEEGDRAGAYTYANFDDYEMVTAHSDRILARIQDSAYPMPPAGGVPEEVIERMVTWLECGMPE